MDEPGAVSLGEAFARLQQVRDGLLQGESTPGRQELLEVRPVEVLCDQIGFAGGQRAGIGESPDMVTAEPHSGSDPLLEAGSIPISAQPFGLQDLEDHPPVQGQLGGRDRLTNGSPSQDLLDLEPSGQDHSRADGGRAGCRRERGFGAVLQRYSSTSMWCFLSQRWICIRALPR